jgi:hypothetical protein
MDIDRPLELSVVTSWLDRLIRVRTNSPKAPPCTRAAIMSLIPFKLCKLDGVKGEESKAGESRDISAEMFIELHLFIASTLVPFLISNGKDVLSAWRDGTLRLGDDVFDLEKGGEKNTTEKKNEKKNEKDAAYAANDDKHKKEDRMEETASNRWTAAGSVFRIRLYCRHAATTSELILSFNFARSRRYVFLAKMTSGRATYTWMSSNRSISQQRPLRTLGDFADALWPYLCYVEIQPNRRVLAPNYFHSTHWRSSFNTRYCRRLRDLLTGAPSSLKRSRMPAEEAAAPNSKSEVRRNKWTQRLLFLSKDDRHLAACASGVGLDLDGKLSVLPHFLMLRIWGLCCWTQRAPAPFFNDRRGRPTHPPPPNENDTAYLLHDR